MPVDQYTITQPQVEIYGDDTWRGPSIKFLGDIADMRNTPVNTGNASSIYIPPNMHLEVYDYPHYNRNHHWGIMRGIHPDLERYPNPAIGGDQLDSVKSIVDIPWKDYLYKCCTKSLDVNQGDCKNFWGGDANSSCDAFMAEECKSRPDELACSCYAKPPDTDDTIEMQHLKANPACYSGECNIYGYMPANIRNMSCPPITICRQNLGTAGDSNMMTGNVIVQDCYKAPEPTAPSSTDINGGPDSTEINTGSLTADDNGNYVGSAGVGYSISAVDTSTGISSNTILYLLLFLVFVVFMSILLSSDGDNPNKSIVNTSPNYNSMSQASVI